MLCAGRPRILGSALRCAWEPWDVSALCADALRGMSVLTPDHADAGVPAHPTSMVEVAARVAALDPAADVDDVVGRLVQIERARDGFYDPDGGGPAARAARAPRPDGVACFNGLYLCVTRAVREALPRFAARAFVERLDVVFAEFYFEAYRAATAGAWSSRAWAPLFEASDARRVLPLQFALAGMNAHINNDLAYALVQTWRELGLEPGVDTPEHRDFVAVNGILKGVEQRVKTVLEDPFVADLDHLLGCVDDRLALWSVAKARSDAWERALHMHAHPDALYDAFHDRAVGFAGHLLLAPVLP